MILSVWDRSKDLVVHYALHKGKFTVIIWTRYKTLIHTKKLCTEFKKLAGTETLLSAKS